MFLAVPFVQAPGELKVPGPILAAEGLAAALAGAALTVIVSRWIARRTSWGRALRDEFRMVLGALDSRQILTLSLLSAFGEELLFRGIFLGWLGLWWSSALFGVFHFPVRRRLIPWTLFAAVLGVALGALTQWTQTLWPAILLHFAINYFNLHDLVEGEAQGRG
jgi:membrane protease YdiL (CAAX protease family)